MKSALPLILDLSGRLVVAVGGGPVSARRVRAPLRRGSGCSRHLAMGL